MKNQEFIINTEAGVVVFCQKSHGKCFTSRTKVDDIKNFNIGIGQLIAMKRNEIAIRKEDIKSMKEVVSDCKTKAKDPSNYGTTAGKLYTNFAQIAIDKIKMSYNHIHELQEDLNALYTGTYAVRPYAEILEDHRVIRKGTDVEKEEIYKKPYAVPQEIIDETHIFEVIGGTTRLKKL